MRSKGGNPAKVAWLVIAGLLVFMLAFAAGCGSSDDSTTAEPERRADASSARARARST